MNVMDAIYHRRSVREFTEAPVDAEMIRLLIAAAVQAPNAMNRQSWSFVVVEDQAMLARCSEQAKAYLLATLAPDSDAMQFREHLASPNFDIFHGAPTLILICATGGDEWATQDCCLAAQNLMLAAFANGLGTCWIGFAQAWLNHPDGKKELGIPSHFRPIAPIIVGHPKSQAAATSRHSPDILWIER